MKFQGWVTATTGIWRVLIASALACFCLPVSAATLVGTQVDNDFTTHYFSGAVEMEDTSETDSFVVQELTDVSVAYLGDQPQPVSSPSQQTLLAYEVSHLGNGDEQYLFEFENLADDAFDALTPVIYIDDGDEIFDPNVDVVYDANTPPAFTAEQIRYVFVTVAIPSGQSVGDIANTRLTATAVSLGDQAGQPGALVAGGGDGGTDLVAGANGGVGVSELALEVTNTAALLLSKSLADTQDPNGGNRPLPGAVLTYEIEVTYTGEGELTNVVINDVIPNNTDFVVGSLKLDNIAQSDAEDTDAGHFDEFNNLVVFALGDVVAPSANQVISFQVTIK